MSHWLKKPQRFLTALLALAMMVFCGFQNFAAAATATPAQDQVTSQLASATANHSIKFKTPSGINSPTDTVTLDLSSFTFGSVGVGDIDLFHGPITGLENSDVLTGAPGIGVWGVGIAGGVITFTPPTNAAPGLVPNNDYITIYIGTQAAGGINQLTNPALAGNYIVSIAGNFGDKNQVAIPIQTDDGMAVSASVGQPPVIVTLVPNSVHVNTSAFTLTVNGHHFETGSIVRLDGVDRVTTYVSPDVVTAQIPATDITTVGTRSITVWNPGIALLSNSAILTVFTPPSGPSHNPPVISNVHAINITQDSARIVWDTDESADSQVVYGLTVAYGSSASNGTFVLSHGLDLSSLTPNTLYHFMVSSMDSQGYSASSIDYTFTTLSASPLTIDNVTSTTITDTSAVITWDTNRSASSLVEYGLTPSLGSWGSVAGDTINHSVPLSSLQMDSLYYYLVTSQDTFSQSATSTVFTFHTLADHTPPTNVALMATPGDTVVLLGWNHSPEPDFAGVRLVRKTGGYPTGPTDGTLVYNGLATSTLDVGLTNGVTYYYGAYAYDTHGNFASGALASATPFGPIQTPPTTTPPIPPSTTTPPTPPTPPTQPVTPGQPTSTQPTTPGLGQITIHVLYYGANGTVLLQPDPQGNYGVLADSSVFAYVPTANLGSTPQFGIMTVAGHSYALTLNADGTAYTGTFLAPSDGSFKSDVNITFQNGQAGRAEDPFQVQFAGKVVEDQLVQGNPVTVPGAKVTLYENRNGAWVIWNGSPYGQANPSTSDQNGNFVYVVPNGTYYADVQKDGFTETRTPTYNISDNVFGNRVPLIRIPKPLVATGTFPFIQNIPSQINFVSLVARAAARQPAIVAAVNDYTAPSLLTISLVNTAAALPLFSLFSYLQFLFTQPILLFGRQKKKRWGSVYNSLTKQPVEFAVVRLIHYESHLVVQTRVTDKFGRYVFYPKAGNYLLEVRKPGYYFPTQYLGDQKVDGEYTDLYHGEMIALTDQSPIAFNIPVDPVTSLETPRRVIYSHLFRRLQHGLAFSGILLSLIALLIIPSWPMFAIFVAQVLFYLLFRRLALPAKAKSWGRVYDSATRKPVKGAIIRIFDRKFNKLLETQLSDDRGRYGFFADKNIFYLTVEKPGYAKFVTEDINLVKTKKEGVIDFSLGLKPASK